MRVAVVAMETSHHQDTEGRDHIDRVVDELAAAGHDVTVFCSQWWDGTGKWFEPESVTYRSVTVSPSPPSFCLRLPPMLAAHRPDIVHVIPDTPAVVLAAGVGARIARAPLVVEWYGDHIPSGRWAGRALSRPDHFVTPSELVQTRLRESGTPTDRTSVIPEGIDMDRIRGIEPAHSIDVVYARRLDENANIQSLFLALAELRDKEWSATIIGDGPKREAYEQAARDLRIADRIEFVGACDRERRISLYRGAQVFVQTAFRESFARELLWALACGCIGIVEYQVDSSAHELVEHRDRAFRVTTPQEIADTIIDAADMEQRTIENSFSSFDHSEIVYEYETLYHSQISEYGLL
jgi:glycosyltransferase involved in cell wall biosynthesis